MVYNKKKTAECCLNQRAENEARTRDPNLGKVVLYQLSYFRVLRIFSSISHFLAKVENLIILRQGCALPTELFPHKCLILVNCEGDETRTHTTQRSLPPQSSASTNSATPP